MIKTPVQQLIEWVEGKIDMPCFNTQHLMEQEQWEKVLEKCQSLLPVEQQMMEDVLDWAAHEGFVHVIDEKFNKKYWFKVGSEKEYTTTELLQLFTNQNEGK